MSNDKNQPRQIREFYYDNLRFEASYQAQFGQASSMQLGRLELSTKKHPTQYSARWVMGSPVVFVQWLTHDQQVKGRHIPWSHIMYADEIDKDDEPAELFRR